MGSLSGCYLKASEMFNGFSSQQIQDCCIISRFLLALSIVGPASTIYNATWWKGFVLRIRHRSYWVSVNNASFISEIFEKVFWIYIYLQLKLKSEGVNVHADLKQVIYTLFEIPLYLVPSSRILEYTSILHFVPMAWWLNNLAQRQFYLYLSAEDFASLVGLDLYFWQK